MRIYDDFFDTVLASSISIGATTLTLSSGKGALLNSPTGGDYGILILTDSVNYEAVKYTARSVDTLTIVRGQHGTTAQAWAANTRIYASVTANDLGDLYPQFDTGGNAKGANSVNIQPARANVANVASGAGAIVIGNDTKAPGAHDVCIGDSSFTTLGSSVSIGYALTNSGQNAIMIGASGAATGGYSVNISPSGGNVSGSDAVGIGPGINVTASGAIGIGANTSSTGTGNIAFGNGASSTGGTGIVAIGPTAIGTTGTATAVGDRAEARGYRTTAIGNLAVASSSGAIAIGSQNLADASDAVAVGDQTLAHGPRSIALGNNSKALADDSIAVRGIVARIQNSIMMHGFHVVKMDDWDDGAESYSNAPESIIMTPYFDIGVPATWATATTYKHGDIVNPTAPNTYQYRLWCPGDTTVISTKKTHTSSTEPTWPTTVGNTFDNADGSSWICQKPSTTYLMQSPPAGTVFVPLSFGFLCNKFSALTGTPQVSVGIDSAHTQYVNAGNVAITAVGEFFQFTSTPVKSVSDAQQLAFTLATAATAGTCQGRFWARGFFVELPDHA